MFRYSHHKNIIVKTIAILMSLMIIAGCSSNKKKGQSGSNGKKTVKLVYVNWAEGVAMTNLAKAILQDKMGYNVKLTMADVAPVFTSVANGDDDAFLDAWLPVTHAQYMKKYGSKLVDLGYNYQGARIGLVVPKYFNINSITQLNSVKNKVDDKIIGIDSGAGIMQKTSQAVKAYNLQLKLIPSSGPAMTASLKQAISNHKPIVVTGWKPHWMFARFNLKFLKDPKGIYGKAENIHTVARKGLKKDMPRVAKFLENFELNDQQLGSLMNDVRLSKTNALDAAKKWMKNNQKLVNSWIPKAKSNSSM
ncbi:MAG TPA: glycine betaine ABC transporter substrate-binding protein [Balneolales bacterium]|nr:glycine betaine ABC transporter substrate-binding protein [Balneolales bacterium]